MWVRHRREGLTLVVAARRRSRWFVLVAGMTEAGFAGNQRYLIVTTAGACVLGGLGAARVLQGVGWLGARAFKDERAGALTAAGAFFVSLAVFSPFIVEKADNTGSVSGRAAPRGPAVARPQGPDRRGGRPRAHRGVRPGVFSGPFQTQMVAYHLHLHGIQVGSIVDARAGRGVPHPDGARRPARGQADRRPLPARGHQGQVASAHRAAGARGSRVSACGAGRSDGAAAAGLTRAGRRNARTNHYDRPVASVASRARALPSVGPLSTGLLVPAAVLFVLFAASLYLRTKSLGESLWMDEGLSIGIASQPLFDIPGVLRVDGSPPLYYMLLSVWIDVFGDGPADTQSLSMVDRAAHDPRRDVGRLEPLRPARRPDLRGALRGQPLPHELRAGDAHVLAHAAALAAHGGGLPARVRVPPALATCRRS